MRLSTIHSVSKTQPRNARSAVTICGLLNDVSPKHLVRGTCAWQSPNTVVYFLPLAFGLTPSLPVSLSPPPLSSLILPFLSSLLTRENALWPPGLVLALSLPINNRFQWGSAGSQLGRQALAGSSIRSPRRQGQGPAQAAEKPALVTLPFPFPSVTDKSMAGFTKSGKKPKESSRASQHQGL